MQNMSEQKANIIGLIDTATLGKIAANASRKGVSASQEASSILDEWAKSQPDITPEIRTTENAEAQK